MSILDKVNVGILLDNMRELGANAISVKRVSSQLNISYSELLSEYDDIILVKNDEYYIKIK